MREQVAFMECPNPRCRCDDGKDMKWWNDSGNREWFVYAGDSLTAYNCPACERPGRQYVY